LDFDQMKWLLWVAFSEAIEIYSVVTTTTLNYEFGYIATVTQNGEPTTVELAQYSCVSANSVLWSLGCGSSQNVLVGCGVNVIDEIIRLDADGISDQNPILAPFPKSIALGVDLALPSMFYIVDSPHDLILRLSHVGLMNGSVVSSCIFALPQEYTFQLNVIEQMVHATTDNSFFYLMGNVPNTMDFVIVSLSLQFPDGGVCTGTVTNVTFSGFPSPPYPSIGFACPSTTTLLVPVTCDWQSTLLAQIEIGTGVATPLPNSLISPPNVFYAGGYDGNGNYIMVTTNEWPLWTSFSFNLLSQQFVASNALNITISDESFWIRGICPYA